MMEILGVHLGTGDCVDLCCLLVCKTNTFRVSWSFAATYELEALSTAVALCSVIAGVILPQVIVEGVRGVIQKYFDFVPCPSAAFSVVAIWSPSWPFLISCWDYWPSNLSVPSLWHSYTFQEEQSALSLPKDATGSYWLVYITAFLIYLFSLCYYIHPTYRRSSFFQPEEASLSSL